MAQAAVTNPTNGHIYQFVDTNVNFATAISGAANLPHQCGQAGHLVSITSEEERNFINEFVYSLAAWIGLSDDPDILGDNFVADGTFVWIDSGEPLGTTYNNFDTGQGGAGGTRNCAAKNNGPTAPWFSTTCTNLNKYIAEFDCPDPYFDLDIELDGNNPINISLASGTDFDEAIQILYDYTGPTPSMDSRVKFNYTVLDYNCTNVFAAHNDTSQALKFTGFNFSEPGGHVRAKLGIALDLIENSAVWSQPVGVETSAFLRFCGRWEIYINDVYMTFHEVMVNATINLKEDGGFDLSSLTAGVQLNLVDADTQSQQVQVQFPVSVFFCNETAEAEDPPDPMYQGTTIQVCLKLATPTSGVYVQSIHEMTYYADQYTGNPVALFENGELKFKSTTQVDCGSVPSLCRVMFLAQADMFVAADDTNTNNLIIAGWAVVALGSDPDGSTWRRNLLEKGERLAPFELVLKNLQPLPDQDSVRSEFPVVILAVVGVFVLVAIAAVVVFFLFRRRAIVRKAAEEKSAG